MEKLSETLDVRAAMVLLVDDDGEALLSLAKALRSAALPGNIEAAGTPDRALELARKIDPHVAVIDLSLNPGEGVESGFRLLGALLVQNPFCRVIVLTGHSSLAHGIRALDMGASHFLEKPADIPHLSALIKDSIAQSNLKRECANLRETGGAAGLSEFIVGNSAAIQSVRDAVLFAGHSSQNVLITGETGTGKGLCAAAIHRFSARKNAKFIRYQPNFASADLVNSDLFGHSKGAFTGALEDRRGLIADAHQGTLFLDEIDELPLETQVTLLGVLQERKFRPLGSNREQEADFRLISATNRDPSQSLKERKLRQDFYHRIAHLAILLPSLKERKEDIPLLAESILKRLLEREQIPIVQFSESSLHAMSAYDWPGNVRELEAAVEGAAFKSRYRGGMVIEPVDLPIAKAAGKSASGAVNFHEQVEAFKFKLIADALQRSGGNQLKAAADLGLDRSSFRRIMLRNREG